MVRRRPGLRDFLSVSAPAVLNALFTAALGVLTARQLGPAGQGALTTIVTVGAILSLVLTLGTGVSVRLRARPRAKEADVGVFLGASLVMALMAAIIAPFFCRWFGLGLGQVELILAALVASVLLAARQSSDLLQAQGRAPLSIALLAAGSLVQCLLFGLAASTGHATLRIALLCVAAGAAVQTVWGLVAAASAGPLPRPNLARPTLSILIRLGVPAVGYTVSLVVVQRLDRLVLVAVLGPVAGGIYAVAATMAEASRITSTAVGQLLFVQTAAAGAITRTSRRTYLLALVVQTAVAAGGCLIAPVAVPLLFGDAYVEAVPLARWLLVAELFMGLALMDARMLMGIHRVPMVAWTTALLLVLAVPTYYLLVSRYGTGGAVAASMLLYIVYAGVLLTARMRVERKVAHVVLPA